MQNEYIRNSTAAIFLFREPLNGWRFADTQEHRAREDWTKQIELYQFVSESHTIILYFNAIREYADEHNLDYTEAYEYALACAMFEALHFECFSNAYVFQEKSKKNDYITCSLSEFYAYMYCNDQGYIPVVRYLLTTWEKYFFTTWPYAHALHFLYGRRHALSYTDSIKKHYQVYLRTNSIDPNSIDDALDYLYRG